MEKFSKEQKKELFNHILNNLENVQNKTFDAKTNAFTIHLKEPLNDQQFNRLVQSKIIKSRDYVCDKHKLNQDELDPSFIFTLSVDKKNARISF